MPTKRINIETYLEIWSLPTEMLTSRQTRFSNVFMSDDFFKACVLLNEKKRTSSSPTSELSIVDYLLIKLKKKPSCYAHWWRLKLEYWHYNYSDEQWTIFFKINTYFIKTTQRNSLNMWYDKSLIQCAKRLFFFNENISISLDINRIKVIVLDLQD